MPIIALGIACLRASPAGSPFLVTVSDENGVAVPSARVTLTSPQTTLAGGTDYAGRREFSVVPAGAYQVRVEKEGFYALVQKEVRVGEGASLEVTLTHVREYKETVNVVYAPPALDPQEASDRRSLSSEDIVDLPYTVTRDIRYALPMLPGVLQDAYGQVHVDGSSTRMIFDQIDGFNASDPATGLFNMRVSVDALRSAEVESSRVSSEYGKGSAGVLSLRTGMGDNHLRFSATDFLPSLQDRRGFNINTWSPRVTVSGPLKKNRAWFLNAADGEYDLNIFKELPPNADRTAAWRFSNLSKAQVNLTPGNILTSSLLLNGFRANHAGLSPFSPLETTLNQTNSAALFTLKDQWIFPGGMLLEAGAGGSEFRDGFSPLGNQTYVITPDGASGNYFETAHQRSSRVEGIANVFFPPLHRGGQHAFKVGMDLDRLTDHQSFEREPVLIRREDATLSRRITFSDVPAFNKNNFEAGFYALDRWTPSDRWLVEPGIRLDWDEVVREVAVAPRVAMTYLLRRSGTTKLVGGIGIYHDATNLGLITRSLTGQRIDLFYDSTGQSLLRPPVETRFIVNESELRVPQFLNWSVGAEQMLPRAVYLRTQFVQKRGRDGWTFINEGLNAQKPFSGVFQLKNDRRDRYDAFEISARHTFKANHVVFASYTRSAARSNATLNFNIDNPLFSQQVGGPLAWDTPNRFISWGWLPFLRGFELAYWLDWHDGFPLFLVNQDQQVVAPPGARRFPTYFSLNVAAERRFDLLGLQWAMRGGFDDVTNRSNPSYVDNNVDSPHFLTFGGANGRTLVGRIRLLGRK